MKNYLLVIIVFGSLETLSQQSPRYPFPHTPPGGVVRCYPISYISMVGLSYGVLKGNAGVSADISMIRPGGLYLFSHSHFDWRIRQNNNRYLSIDVTREVPANISALTFICSGYKSILTDNTKIDQQYLGLMVEHDRLGEISVSFAFQQFKHKEHGYNAGGVRLQAGRGIGNRCEVNVSSVAGIGHWQFAAKIKENIAGPIFIAAGWEKIGDWQELLVSVMCEL